MAGGRRGGAGSADGYLYRVDTQSGQEISKFKAGGGVDSSLAISDGVVYFGSGSSVYAVNIQPGQEKWKFVDLSWPVTSGVALSHGVVYFGGFSSLYAVDTPSGQKKWKSWPAPWIGSSLAISDGVIYFGGSEDEDGYLYAVK